MLITHLELLLCSKGVIRITTYGISRRVLLPTSSTTYNIRISDRKFKYGIAGGESGLLLIRALAKCKKDYYVVFTSEELSENSRHDHVASDNTGSREHLDHLQTNVIGLGTRYRDCLPIPGHPLFNRQSFKG